MSAPLSSEMRCIYVEPHGMWHVVVGTRVILSTPAFPTEDEVRAALEQHAPQHDELARSKI